MCMQVLQTAVKALDDKKRAVRQEAVRCRRAWCVNSLGTSQYIIIFVSSNISFLPYESLTLNIHAGSRSLKGTSFSGFNIAGSKAYLAILLVPDEVVHGSHAIHRRVSLTLTRDRRVSQYLYYR
jgi:hypothetical protein